MRVDDCFAKVRWSNCGSSNRAHRSDKNIIGHNYVVGEFIEFVRCDKPPKALDELIWQYIFDANDSDSAPNEFSFLERTSEGTNAKGTVVVEREIADSDHRRSGSLAHGRHLKNLGHESAKSF